MASNARIDVKFGGIGIVDIEGDVYWDKAYPVWYDMLGRCRPEKWTGKLLSYYGCSVDESFCRYSAFKAWLDNRWLPGHQLDKDIKSRGNKVYGADTCLVVSKEMNQAFQLRASASSGLAGVKVRPNGRFAAMLRDELGRDYAKHFKTAEEAHACWQMNKADVIEWLAMFEPDEAKPFIAARVAMLRQDAKNGTLTKGAL